MNELEGRSSRGVSRRFASMLLAVASATCAPAQSARPPVPDGPPVYVGRVEGSDALVAVVAQSGTIVAYTCGGSQSWETHTGWFHPLPDEAATEGATLTIPTTRSARGLELRGTIERERATGTLQLVDGRTLTWSADRADPRTGAGFFTQNDGEALAGLIVTNDGAMAGVSVGISGDDERTPSPITATPPTNTTTTVTGTVVTGTPVNLQRTPVTQLVQVARRGPSIIVLLHGVTSEGDQSFVENGALTTDEDLTRVAGAPVVKPHPGTRLHARSYWTAPFVSGLLYGRPTGPLFTLGTGIDVSGDNFLRASTAVDITTTPVTRAPPAGDCNLDDFIIPTPPPTPSSTPGALPQAPQVSLLLAHRDGKLSFMRQVMDATDQVYRCVELYQQRFQIQPSLVFVAHSGGGLVTRAILSNPSRQAMAMAGAQDVSLAESAHYDRQNINGDPMSTRQKMAYLRDRAQFAVTLATPHQGSPFADFAERARPEVERVIQWLRAGANADFPRFDLTLPVVTAINATASATVIRRPEPLANTVLESAEAVTRRASAELLAVLTEKVGRLHDNNPINLELTSTFWRAMNRGALAPHRARRSPSSPIPGAAGALVPIYTAGARAAGSDLFDSLDVNEIGRGLSGLNTRQMSSRALGWTIGLTFVDGLMRVYGGIPNATPANAARLDRVRVGGWAREVTGMYERRSVVLEGAFRAVYRLSALDEAQNIAQYLSNETGLRLNQESLIAPVFLSRPWELTDRPVAFPVPALRCTANDGTRLDLPFDYTPMLRGLVSTFGTIDDALRAIRDQNFSALMTRFEGLGGALAATVPNLRADFDALFRAAAHPECVDPTRWRVVATTRSVQIPLPTELTSSASDGMVDYDGFVLYDSAHGFSLGQDGTNGTPNVAEFFDHTHLDDTSGDSPRPGSWYRRYTSALERFNHEIQRFETGEWIYASILSRNPGPLPAISGELSVHPSR